MPIPERAERLPLTVDREVLDLITRADTPNAAAEMVLSYDVEVAVAIIDNLDPLTAAFVVSVLRTWAKSDVFETPVRAGQIIVLGSGLQIRGMNGLCYARDQVYRETGYFAGT